MSELDITVKLCDLPQTLYIVTTLQICPFKDLLLMNCSYNVAGNYLVFDSLTAHGKLHHMKIRTNCVKDFYYSCLSKGVLGYSEAQ